ncbi:MAG: site-specific integrase [Candidatus Methanoperedens sp.]|nr:site-specific integrase [Candidatus Methanoperedens sp.]
MKLASDRYKSGEKALTRQEYDKLIAVITDLQDELLIKLAVATGIRREDLCNIKFDDLHLKDSQLVFWESKKSRQRTIDLPESIIVLVTKFYNSMDKQDLKKREYLFDFVGRTAYRHFNEWCVIAGIPERPFHALRATCIKFCHAAGWSDEQISKLTGDKISTIQEHYMTPSVDEMRQVIQDKAIV